MFWWTLTFFVLGLSAVATVQRHLREAKLVKIRSMVHKERMAALERNIPIADVEPDAIDLLRGDARAQDAADRVARDDSRGVRLMALALGLTCLFLGIAIIPAFYYQAEPDIQGTWPVGLIPIAVGIGLLLFVRISKGLVENQNGHEGS